MAIPAALQFVGNLLPQVISAVAPSLTSLYNNKRNISATNETNQTAMDFSRESASTAFERQKELLEYNSPANQVQRLSDAGLNPSLAYSNLDFSFPSVDQASTPSLSVPTSNLSFSFDDMLKLSQKNRLDAAAENETKLTDAEVENLFKGLDVKDAEIKSLQANVDMLTARISEMNSNATYLDSKTRLNLLDEYIRSNAKDSIVSSLVSQGIMDRTKASYFGDYMAASILNLKHQANMYLSQAHLSQAQVQVANAMARYYKASAIGQENENVISGTKADAYGLPQSLLGDYDFSQNAPFGLQYEVATMLNNRDIGTNSVKQGNLNNQILTMSAEYARVFGNSENTFRYINGLIGTADHVLEYMFNGISRVRGLRLGK